MATRREYQGTSNANNSLPSSTFWASQTWTTTTGAYSVTGVKLWLSRAGAFTGTITISLRATDGSNKPTGADLATMSFDGSTLTTSSSGDGVTRNFDTPYELSASTVYAFVFRTSGPGLPRYRRMAANPYGNGAIHTSTDSGSTWGDASSQDFKFEIWGDDLSNPPTKAENPLPTDANTSVTLDQATISWDDGGGADTFDVYYGTESGNLTKVSTAQAGESFTITGITDGSPLDYLSVRYWRIDSTNADGTTTGDEWTFTTFRFDPPVQTYFNPEKGPGGKWYYYLLIDFDGDYGDHPWDGGVEDTDWSYRPLGYEPNFIATVRKLVSAANSKIWFEDV